MPLKVKEFMTKDPISHVVPSPINEIVSILIKNNITGIPLRNQDGKYVGMVSRKDIFKNPEETQLAMVMRKSEPVNENDSIEDAAKIIVSQGHRHITVVNDNNEIVGILTPQNFLSFVREKFGTIPVDRFSSKFVYPVWNKTPLPVFYHIIQITSLYAFPVIDRDGKLIGIVTDRDIFDNIDLRTELIKSETGMADDEDPWSWSGIRNVFSYFVQRNRISLPDIPLDDVTIKNPYYVVSDSPLSDAVEVMLKGNYNQLPVLSGEGKLRSMLYDIDILGVFLEDH